LHDGGYNRPARLAPAPRSSLDREPDTSRGRRVR